MQIKVTASLLLALGFVTGTAWLFASRADAQAGSAFLSTAGSLPAPRSMVVFDSMPVAGGTGSVQIPPGGFITVATVPANRWLVITDYDQAYGYNVDLVEDLAGVITVKRHDMIEPNFNSDRFHSSIGMSFAPGSQIVLRNNSASWRDLRYHLAGYWVVL